MSLYLSQSKIFDVAAYLDIDGAEFRDVLLGSLQDHHLHASIPPGQRNPRRLHQETCMSCTQDGFGRILHVAACKCCSLQVHGIDGRATAAKSPSY
ncbi:hypothetical protein N7468_005337 [Penicillium chermesinum]|uniref:Uncharacterized protein n=1 Tax=Penicillium chermesinum TaxID=63820 RepID=A0A9W9NZ04_9EURO|nr:uncharacterized protein N7468_005337 [Penicillium chermesinum]KAJ5232381.1 hypothetical protein N7468_005337 [Penicillium chermesinum]